MLSAPATVGVKLTAAAKEDPPLNVPEHVPVVATVADAVVLVLAAKLTEGAGVPLHEVSLRMAVTGFSVAEGLTGVPAGDTGTVTLSIVSCATVSAPPELITPEDAAG
jgi:hypothetical protein